MKAITFGLFFIIMGAHWSVAQQASADQGIIKLSEEKCQWMADKNVEALDDLFDEKSMFVHMGGSWGKQRELDVIQSGGIWYKKADIHEDRKRTRLNSSNYCASRMLSSTCYIKLF